MNKEIAIKTSPVILIGKETLFCMEVSVEDPARELLSGILALVSVCSR